MQSIKAIFTPISGSIHERSTFLDTSHGIPDVLNVSSAGSETMPNSSSDLSSRSFIRESTTSRSPKFTCCKVEFRICDIFDLGHAYTCTCDYLRVYSKLSARLKLLSLKQPSASSEQILNELK